MDRDHRIGLGLVAYRRALVDAGPDALVAWPGELHGGSARPEDLGQPVRDIEGVRVLRITGVGRGSGGVTGLLGRTGRNLTVDDLRILVVEPVVARVDHDDLAGQRTGRGGMRGGR